MIACRKPGSGRCRASGRCLARSISGPCCTALATVGYDVVLPVTPERGHPLTFRKWNIDDALLLGRYGTQHTNGVEMIPDFLLVPLLGFDACGQSIRLWRRIL